MPRLKYKNDETGQIVSFDWHLDTEPTEQDLDEIFAEVAKVKAPSSVETPVEGDIPRSQFVPEPEPAIASTTAVSPTFEEPIAPRPAAEAFADVAKTGVKSVATGVQDIASGFVGAMQRTEEAKRREQKDILLKSQRGEKLSLREKLMLPVIEQKARLAGEAVDVLKKTRGKVEEALPKTWKDVSAKDASGPMVPTGDATWDDVAKTWVAIAGQTVPQLLLSAIPVAGIPAIMTKESQSYADRADQLGIPPDIRDKYSAIYGGASGIIERAQSVTQLTKPFKKAAKPIIDKTVGAILKKVGSIAGEAVSEGAEEASQGFLMESLLGKAIKDAIKKDPEWEPQGALPGYDWKQAKRDFLAGAGLGVILKGVSTVPRIGATIAQQVEDTDVAQQRQPVPIEGPTIAEAAQEEIAKLEQEQPPVDQIIADQTVSESITEQPTEPTITEEPVIETPIVEEQLTPQVEPDVVTEPDVVEDVTGQDVTVETNVPEVKVRKDTKGVIDVVEKGNENALAKTKEVLDNENDISDEIKPVDEMTSEEDKISIKNRIIEDLRERLGLDVLDSPNKESLVQWYNTAVEQKINEKATRIATEVMTSDRDLSPEESAGITIKMAELITEHEALSKQLETLKDSAEIASISNEMRLIESEVDLLTKATKRSGTETARRLVARKLTIDRDMRLAPTLNRMKSAKGKDLTFKERTRVKKIVEEYQTAQSRIKELETKVNGLLANNYVKTIARKKYKNKTNAEISAEYNQLLNNVKVLIKAGCHK